MVWHRPASYWLTDCDALTVALLLQHGTHSLPSQLWHKTCDRDQPGNTNVGSQSALCVCYRLTQRWHTAVIYIQGRGLMHMLRPRKSTMSTLNITEVRVQGSNKKCVCVLYFFPGGHLDKIYLYLIFFLFLSKFCFTCTKVQGTCMAIKCHKTPRWHEKPKGNLSSEARRFQKFILQNEVSFLVYVESCNPLWLYVVALCM